MTPVIAYLALGSNLGDRLQYLKDALDDLSRHELIKIDAVSSVYETDPVGFLDQPAFLNAVVRIITGLAPLELLHTCQAVEVRYGRKRTVHWGPRTIDIDLLTYGSLQMDSSELVLPHPRMAERDFVLVPLEELITGHIRPTDRVRLAQTEWYQLQ